MNKRVIVMLAVAGLMGMAQAAAEKKAGKEKKAKTEQKEKKIKQSFDLRLINFTPDTFDRVKVVDSSKKAKTFYDGRLNDQSYIMLKKVNRKKLPLTVSVWESAGARESTDLLVEDVKSEDIKVEPKDLWSLYRDDN